MILTSTAFTKQYEIPVRYLNKQQLLKAMDGHVLATATLSGTYECKKADFQTTSSA